MDKMRNFLQSWQGRVAMVAILAPMAFLGVGGNFGSSVSPNELIKVGKQAIDVGTYQSEINAYRSQLLATAGVNASMIDEETLKQEILDSLVNRAVLQHQTHVLGMTISDEEITRLLQQEPGFQQDGQFSNDLFAAFLQQNRLTKDELFANFRTQLSVRQLTASILGSAIYPSSQISRLLDLQTEARELWVQRYRWQDYADKVSVDDAKIQAYYQKHKETLVRPDVVDLAYIELTPDLVKIEDVTEDEIKAQYEVYLQQAGLNDNRELAQIILTGDDAQAKAEQIKAKLDKGESFEALAKQHSDDPSGATGGKMGSYNPAVFGADAGAVSNALSGLTVGQVSVPVKTSFGYHIFKVLKVSDGPSIESVRDQLIQMAAKHKRKVAFDEMVAKINTMATDGMGIADIAAQTQLDAQNIKAYPKTGNQTQLSQPAVLAAAFDEFAVQDQSVSANITLGDKTVWVQPSNFQAQKQLSLEEATEQIKAILVREQAVALALADAQKAATEAKANGVRSLTTTANNFGITTRQNPALSPAERASLFTHKSGGDDVWAVQTEDGASVLVGGPVAQQATAQIGENERRQAAIVIRDNVGESLFSDYLHYLRDTSEVVINQDALKSQS